METITEIIPDDMPDWAREAMLAGILFDTVFKRISYLEKENTKLNEKLEGSNESIESGT